MANTSTIRQQAAHTTYHLPAAQQEPYKKAYVLLNFFGEFSRRSQEKGPLAEKWQEGKSKNIRQKKQERR